MRAGGRRSEDEDLCFSVYFEAEELKGRVEPHLRRLEDRGFRFDRHPSRENPELYTYLGGSWCGFVVPSTPGTLYLFDGDAQRDVHASGILGSSLSVAVREDEPGGELWLRMYGDLLRTLCLPVEEMREREEDFLSRAERAALGLLERCGLTVHRPLVRARFYDHLLETYREREEGD